jgi:two-component system, OmpR family, alkaline phosphatase synthesis response regulator PhoP
MSRILVVEDETHIAEGVRYNFEAEGHSVRVAGNGEEALRLLLEEKETFEALVLDVMLPGKDGFTVARELREAQNYIPLLMLTARGRSDDVLRGFESGADDYLTKPFNLAILLARVESLLRRMNWVAPSPAASQEPGQSRTEPSDTFCFDDKVVDFKRLQLRSGRETFQLTLMESELLRYLVRNNGRAVSRKAILQDVWNLHEDTDTRAIDNFVVRLRRYIEAEPAKPRYLLTVRGVGYQFVANRKT